MSGKFPDDEKEKRTQMLKVSTENQTEEQQPLDNEEKEKSSFYLIEMRHWD